MKTTILHRIGLWMLLLVLPMAAVAAVSPSSYVDLGLPSKTLWATCNVGAMEPEEYGYYFAWGETTTKSTYSWTNYKYCSGSSSTVRDIGTDIAGTSYDAAKATHGNSWAMPSVEQMNELINNCKLALATVNGVKGIRLTGPNGNTIFFPMAGYKADGSTYKVGEQAYFWSSRKDLITNVAYKAGALYMQRTSSSASVKTTPAQRRTGAPIRAVLVDDGGNDDDLTDSELVDLGLSVKWCNQNIGATAPSKYGDYFAWGETSSKNTFTWANYEYANGSATSAWSIGGNISGTDYDVAYMMYRAYLPQADDWVDTCLPTKAQWDELVSKCTFTATTENGVKGYRVKGPSGKTIFLPYSGYSADGQNVGKGTSAYYWTADHDPSNIQKSYAFYIKSDTKKTTTIQRRTGAAIRAVEYKEVDGGDFQLVDLGLSVKWCNMNLGATTSSPYGNFYAWGETATKSTYTWANYKHAAGTMATVKFLDVHISGNSNYDPAASCGGAWDNDERMMKDVRMPTWHEISDLVEECTFTQVTQSGVKGYKVTGPNGNSIFLPFAGTSYDGSKHSQGTAAYYWSGDVNCDNLEEAEALYIKSGAKPSIAQSLRRTGMCIRPVEDIDNGAVSDFPPIVGARLELVDLGLSVRWCDMDLGLYDYTRAGEFYAWGETSTKSKYTWANYKHASGTAATAKNIGSDIKATSHEAAYEIGSAWDEYDDEVPICLPNKDQVQELISNCTFKPAYRGGLGYRVIGPNGNSIFMHFGGYSADGKEVGQGESAYFWTSEVDASNAQKANTLYIKEGTAPKMTVAQRRTGALIRGVEFAMDVPPCPPAKTPEFVDLGLSVKWADQNVGADWQSEPGDFYAWGETDTKSTYTWANYKHASGTATSVKNIGSNIQATSYDAAYMAYIFTGIYDNEEDDFVDACLPTKAQWEELMSKCTFEESSDYGYSGYMVTGPSGRSIFLPFSGYSADGQNVGVNTSAYYWAANVDASNAQKANTFYIKSGGTKKMTVAQRRTGAAIRAVEYKQSTPPTPSNHEYVDLGLTSKTLWATCNVGASSPEGYGNYYAWGETKTKSTYNWTTYQYCSGTSSSVVDLGNSIAGTSYDAATVNWGSGWVMPTVVQINELVNQCSFSLATVNGVKGLRLTGPNGKSIFFPMSGYKVDATLYKAGEQAYLWSCRKDLITNVAYKAGALYIERSSTSAKAKSTPAQRRTGSPVRAVRASSSGANEGLFETDGIIAAPVTTPSDGAIYNLQGMKMEGELQPGIYVKNGKKFVVK